MAIDFSDVAEPMPSAPRGGMIYFSDVAEPATVNQSTASPKQSAKERILAQLAIPQSNLGGAIRSFGRGASLGLSDVVGEGVNALINSQITGAPFKEQFAADKNQANAERDQFRQDNPALSYGSEIAGAGATIPILSAAGRAVGSAMPYVAGAFEPSTAVGTATRGLTNMGKVAAIAAPQGALYGANEANSGNAASDALTGAEVGGVVGAASVPIGAALGAVADKVVVPVAKNIYNRITKTPQQKAEGYVAAMIREYGDNPEHVINKLQGLGDDAAISDTGTTYRRAEKVASGYLNANKDKAIEELGARQGKQLPETLDIISKGMGGISRDDLFAALESNAKTQKEQASPLYQKALASDLPKSESFEKLKVLEPVIKAMKKSGKYSADIDNVTMQPILDAVGLDTGAKQAVAKSLTEAEKLHNAKIALYDMESATRQSSPNYSRMIGKARRELTDYLDNLDGYKEARQIWAGHEANKYAADIGADLFNMPAAEFKRELANMGDAEKQHVLYGAMNSIGTKLGKRADVQNTAGQLVRNPEIREKMAMLVSPETMQKLEDNAKKWDAFTARKNLMTTGNVTHELGTQKEEMETLGNALGSDPRVLAVKHAINSVMSPYQLNNKTAAPIGEILGKPLSQWDAAELSRVLSNTDAERGLLGDSANNALNFIGRSANSNPANELVIDYQQAINKQKNKTNRLSSK